MANKNKNILLVFFCIILSIVSKGQSVNEAYDGIKNCTEVIKSDATDPFIYLRRGQCYLYLQDFKSAVADYTMAISLGEKHPKSWGKSSKEARLVVKDFTNQIGYDLILRSYIERVEAYQGAKEFENALKDIQYILNKLPNNIDALISLGNIQISKGDFKSAISTFKKRLDVDSLDATANSELATAFYYNKDYKHAITYYTNAINNFNGFDRTDILCRATVYNNLKESSLALEDIDKVLEQNKTDTIALRYRSAVYSGFRKYDLALKDVDVLLALNPSSFSDFCLRGNLYGIVGDYSAGILDEAKAFELRPDGSNYLANEILLLINNNDFKKAAKLRDYYLSHKMTSYVDYYKEYFFLNDYLKTGTTLLVNNQYQSALDSLLKSLSKYQSISKIDSVTEKTYIVNSYANILDKVGWLYEKLGDNSKAMNYYRQALTINNYNVSFSKNINNLQKKMKFEYDHDYQPPTVSIQKSLVTDGVNVSNKYVYLNGIAKDPSGIKQVLINGYVVESLSQDGYFSTRIPYPVKGNLQIHVSDKRNNVSVSNIALNKLRMNVVKPAPPIYHAIIITCSQYKDPKLASLSTVKEESENFEKILINNYGFEKKNIAEIIDAERKDLLSQISTALIGLKENDYVLILFEGHGDIVNGSAAWQPVDCQNGIGYIWPNDIVNFLNSSNAGHVLILSDACFGDAMAKNLGILSKRVSIAKQKSWLVISSGKDRVQGISKFMPLVTKILTQNTEKNLSALSLYKNILLEMRKIEVTHDNEPIYCQLDHDVIGDTFMLTRTQ